MVTKLFLQCGQWDIAEKETVCSPFPLLELPRQWQWWALVHRLAGLRKPQAPFCQRSDEQRENSVHCFWDSNELMTSQTGLKLPPQPKITCESHRKFIKVLTFQRQSNPHPKIMKDTQEHPRISKNCYLLIY